MNQHVNKKNPKELTLLELTFKEDQIRSRVAAFKYDQKHEQELTFNVNKKN